MSLIKKLHITRIVQETEHAKTFFLAPENWQANYEAGQFLTLVFYTKHGEKRRSYSISSSPLEKELSITVKKIDNGEFSRLLLQHAKVGDMLYTSGISGHFRLPEIKNKETHFVFLAAGSGIVPCYSMIKTLLQSSENNITLIYSNKNQSDTIFYKDLKRLQENSNNKFQIRFLFSNSGDVYNRRLSKWLLDILLKEYVGNNFDNTLFYLCGPYEYMQTMEITLRSHTAKQNIIKEHFDTTPPLIIPVPPDTEPHRVSIHINGNSYQFTAQYPKSILAAAIENNIELPYSCRAGRCSACIAACTSGKVWLAYNQILTDKEVESGKILTCQGFPVGGDVEINY